MGAQPCSQPTPPAGSSDGQLAWTRHGGVIRDKDFALDQPCTRQPCNIMHNWSLRAIRCLHPAVRCHFHVLSMSMTSFVLLQAAATILGVQQHVDPGWHYARCYSPSNPSCSEILICDKGDIPRSPIAPQITIRQDGNDRMTARVQIIVEKGNRLPTNLASAYLFINTGERLSGVLRLI
jgi:hypothetical protein